MLNWRNYLDSVYLDCMFFVIIVLKKNMEKINFVEPKSKFTRNVILSVNVKFADTLLAVKIKCFLDVCDLFTESILKETKLDIFV